MLPITINPPPSLQHYAPTECNVMPPAGALVSAALDIIHAGGVRQTATSLNSRAGSGRAAVTRLTRNFRIAHYSPATPNVASDQKY
jgi:hypothetical protein